METSISPSKGIFDRANADTRESVVEMLTKAYWMEIETVTNRDRGDRALHPDD